MNKLLKKSARILGVLGLSVACVGCAAGVKGTPGMKLYSAGDHQQAVPMLMEEVKAGEVSARYPLGLAYRDGNVVEHDPVKAEILLTGAAVGGDPRAVAEVRKMLRDDERCPKDKELHNLWGSMVMYRNLITGVYEFNNAPRNSLRRMAEIYADPCEGRPVQAEAAKSLNAVSMGSRRIWVYVPG